MLTQPGPQRNCEINQLVSVHWLLFSGIHKKSYSPGEGGGAGGTTTTKKALTYRVKQDEQLLKLAEEPFNGNKQLRKEVNALMKQLSDGNVNPGIGTKNIGNDIFAARSKGGVRVYFRNSGPNGVEILGYSNKGNQQAVINRLLKIYSPWLVFCCFGPGI